MAFQLLSLTPEALLETLRTAVEPLLYPSETDAAFEVHTFTAAEVGDLFSPDEIRRLFYGDADTRRVESMEWAEANRLESNGTQRFFRDLTDIITTYPNNEYFVHEQYHRDHAPHWRKLRDLFFDNLVQQRWFRADMAGQDSARADLYLVGRHLQIEVDPDTNEIRTQALDWVVLKTYVIET